MKNNIVKVVILSLSFLLLQACGTTDTTASYQQAKMDFMAQNYAKAFREVQAPARAGNPDAQYALGYMYYYGKGVAENHGLALYWLNKAAAQGQPDAQKALTMIRTKS